MKRSINGNDLDMEQMWSREKQKEKKKVLLALKG
jgi:hypothetical protein